MDSPDRFSPRASVRHVREQLDHPILDADGHLLEHMPVLLDYVRVLGGDDAVQRVVEYQKNAAPKVGASHVRTLWAFPAENTLDRMTALLPELMYRRLGEIGIDFALLYPSIGLTFGFNRNEELRRIQSRALNHYLAETYGPYRDRMEPVAVIPMFTPQEAVEELDFAVGVLGLKCVVMAGVIPRTVRADGSEEPWLDTLGHESLYDYDLVWAKCVELGVVPTFHSQGYGWGTRTSTRNYVYNHLGNFAAAQEAVCRSLVMGGVPRRFPGLRFAFLEGGVSWAAQLLADLISHYEKRNGEAVRQFDPSRLDLDVCDQLLGEFARGAIQERRADVLDALAVAKATSRRDSHDVDEFAEARIRGIDDIVEIFARQFHFGCEADDPFSALAFDATYAKHGPLPAMLSSDIGHWDVPDMRDVVPEAWKLVENGRLDAHQFRDFACTNVARMLTDMNPDFFRGTAVEHDLQSVLSRALEREVHA